MFLNDFHHREIDKVSLEATINKLLEAIVLEEKALADILETKAANIKGFVGESPSLQSESKSSDVLLFSQTIKNIVDQILLKEWLILKNIETVIQLKQKLQAQESDHENKNRV